MLEKFFLFMQFLLNIIKIVKQKLNFCCIDNSRPPASFSSSIVAAEAEAGQDNNRRNRGASADAQTMKWMKWPLLVIGVCLAAVSAVLQALQTTGPLPKATSHLVYMLLVIFLTVVIVSIYIRPNYKRASDVLLHAGVVLGAAALVVPLISELPIPLMVTSITVVSSGIILVVVVACLLKATT